MYAFVFRPILRLLLLGYYMNKYLTTWQNNQVWQQVDIAIFVCPVRLRICALLR